MLVALLLVVARGASAFDAPSCVDADALAWPRRVPADGSVRGCVDACRDVRYSWAAVRRDDCRCGDATSARQRAEADCDERCASGSSDDGACGGANAFSAYRTGAREPTPPLDVRASDATETSVRLAWRPPRARLGVAVDGYRVRANATFTYAPTPPPKLEWSFSANTLRTELAGLHPGTEYAITVSALAGDVVGGEATVAAETAIGEPDPPPKPVIVERHGERAVVRIPNATSANGPVSRYRIVVANEERQRGFAPDRLKAYDDAAAAELPFYITAEIDAAEARYDFVVGDRRRYDSYYNAPLPRSRDVKMYLGVVSSKGGVTRVRYATPGDVVVLAVDDDGDGGGVTALGAAVAASAVLLVGALAALLVVRRRARSRRRRALARSIALSSSSRERERDNGGYVADDPEPPRIDARLPTIPRNFLEIDASPVAKFGEFGRFVRGRVRARSRDETAPCAVHVIAETELSRADATRAREALVAHAECGAHELIAALFGVCETPDALYVAFEDCGATLKRTLLSSRRRDAPAGKLCSLDELDALRFALQVAEAMNHLSDRSVIHGRLCCANVSIAGQSAKLGGFGLNRAWSANERPSYARWTAPEGFAFGVRSPEADVWSFGCLLWELFALGATPYPKLTNEELPSRISKGARPKRLTYVSERLHRLCAQCWKATPAERPTFSCISAALTESLDQPRLEVLNFTDFKEFEYETYDRELEIVRSVR